MAKATGEENGNKKATSFSLSNDHKELLSLICIKERRSKTAVMEMLIEAEAQRLNITLPPKP